MISFDIAPGASSALTTFPGLQIALTQPIRLDDVVIVQGERGRIEEITGAFVVVRRGGAGMGRT